ncbi:hypothetical protein J1614_005788, partial [Plenodomus biglobosus]
MSPIAFHAVRLTQRIKNQALRFKTIKLVEEATKQPDLARFTKPITYKPYGPKAPHYGTLSYRRTGKEREIKSGAYLSGQGRQLCWSYALPRERERG